MDARALVPKELAWELKGGSLNKSKIRGMIRSRLVGQVAQALIQ